MPALRVQNLLQILLLLVQIPQVHVKPGQKQEHQGIKVELIGRVETMTDGTKKSAGLLAAAGWLGRAQLRALTFGGAVWGVFRENANCGDPPGTLRGNLWVPCTFRRGLIWKIRQKSGKIWAKSSKNCQN